MRVRRNFTYDSDFLIQSQVIEEKFIQKGYKQLDKIKQEVKKDDYIEKQWGFIFKFHYQFSEVESIYSKHWHIVHMDRVLGPVLPVVPIFIYRRALKFGGRVVKKILDLPARNPFFTEGKGFFAVNARHAGVQTVM